MGTRTRVTTVAGAATLLCAASAFGAGFSALAAPSTVSTAVTQAAAAPLPMLVGGCGDTVRGAPGQGVGVRTAGLSVIDVGRVPPSGSTTLDATPSLRKTLGPVAPQCNITAEAISPLTAPVEAMIAPTLAPAKGAVSQLPVLAPPSSPGAPSAAPPAAPAAQQPKPAAAPALTPAGFGPFYGPMSPPFSSALGLYSSGLPHYNYAELLAIGRPGSLGRLSAGMLTADLFGTPSVSNGPALGKQSAAANDVAAAGRASALPAGGVERIALPVLVAVGVLGRNSPALLRSWVLGRR
jgi:hypothetical protein